MSDFIFSSARRPDGELRELLGGFLGRVSSTIVEEHGTWGSLAVAACAHDVTPLVRDGGVVTVLLGWPVLHGAAGLASAPVLDDVRRAEVHRLLAGAGPLGSAGQLDGPFAALRVDTDGGTVAALTDRMGFIPLYSAKASNASGGFFVGSHVDAVAIASGRNCDVDPVSAADFVVHSTITYPRTLYHGVEQLPPAAERSWGSGERQGTDRVYWLPLEQPATRYLGRAARTLRRVFAEAVAQGCEGQDRVGLLLSGGEDSRSVLGAIPRGIRVDAFIYGDWENREYRIARRVAAVYGAHLHFGRREPDHYLGYEAVAPILGTQHRYTDVHGYGLHHSLALGDLPIVLGGYLSDSLLKANYAHRPKRRMVRQATPLPGERRGPVIARAEGLREELLREVEVRRAAHCAWIREMRPGSANEWLVLWPFSMRATGANIHGSRRLFRSFEPFVSNGVLEIAAAVPQLWKRERLLFHRAMRPFLARSWYIPHGRSKYPFFGPVANVPLGAGVKCARWVRDRAVGEHRKVQGPWPQLADLVATPAMASCRLSAPLERTPVVDLFERGLAADGLREVQRRWTPEQQLGFLQLVHLVHRVAG